MVNDSYDYEGSKSTSRLPVAKFRQSATVARHRMPSGEFKGRIDAVVKEVGCKRGNNNDKDKDNEDLEEESDETVQGLLEHGAGKVCAEKKYQAHHKEGYQSQRQHHGHRRGQHHRQQYVGKVIKGPDSVVSSNATCSIFPDDISKTKDDAAHRGAKRRDQTKGAKAVSIMDHDSCAPS